MHCTDLLTTFACSAKVQLQITTLMLCSPMGYILILTSELPSSKKQFPLCYDQHLRILGLIESSSRFLLGGKPWKSLEIPSNSYFIHYKIPQYPSPSPTKVLLFDFLDLAIFGPTTLLESSENLQALQQRRGTTLIFFEGVHLARA